MWEHTEGVHGGEVGGHSDFVPVVTETDRDCVRRVLREAARLKNAEQNLEVMMMLDGENVKSSQG